MFLNEESLREDIIYLSDKLRIHPSFVLEEKTRFENCAKQVFAFLEANVLVRQSTGISFLTRRELLSFLAVLAENPFAPGFIQHDLQSYVENILRLHQANETRPQTSYILANNTIESLREKARTNNEFIRE